MGRLSPKDLRSRLAYDARICARLSSPHLVLSAHVSNDAMLNGIVATEAEAEAGQAAMYLARFNFPTLTNAGVTTPTVAVSFNLLAGGNYPFTEPAVNAVTHPRPWSPHVHPGSGAVCIGEVWARSRGQMVLGQLVAHVMRVFNFDEPNRDPSYDGWNAEAIRYWRTTMKCRPLNAGIVYPTMPEDLTHGITNAPAVFAAITTPATPPPAFRAAAPSAPAGGLFRAVAPAQVPTFRRGGGGR